MKFFDSDKIKDYLLKGEVKAAIDVGLNDEKLLNSRYRVIIENLQQRLFSLTTRKIMHVITEDQFDSKRNRIIVDYLELINQFNEVECAGGTNFSPLKLHVLNNDNSVSRSSNSVEIRFTITNLSSRLIKLVNLELLVLKRKEFNEIMIASPGAVYKEIALCADLALKEKVSLFDQIDAQMLFNSNETEAFRVRVVLPEGFKFDCSLIAVGFDLENENEYSVSELISFRSYIKNNKHLMQRLNSKNE